MATLRLPAFTELVGLFTRDNPELKDSGRARAFISHAHATTGGATPDLKRVYNSYVENERKREAAQPKG
jgi:hypothetical protein